MTDVADNIGMIRRLLRLYVVEDGWIVISDDEANGLFRALEDIEAAARALEGGARAPPPPPDNVIHPDFSRKKHPPAPGGAKGGAA